MGFDPVSYILGKQSGGGGGGSNPNYVETVTGTVASPWGNLDAAGLYAALQRGDATAKMLIDPSQLGLPAVEIFISPLVPGYISVQGIADGGANLSGWFAVQIGYNKTNGEFIGAYLLQNGAVVDMSAYAGMIASTITVIHHPLPEDNT